jgi:hypothetical protein
MKLDAPSFAKYFLILLVAFFIAIYQLHKFEDVISLHTFLGKEMSDF